MTCVFFKAKLQVLHAETDLKYALHTSTIMPVIVLLSIDYEIQCRF